MTDRPSFTEPDFEPCYRHLQRRTGINCQRCGRPICRECMVAASVGFQCPECVSTGRATTRQPRRISRVRWSATLVLVGAMVFAYLGDLLFNGIVSQFTVYYAPLVSYGQFWRLVTYIIAPAGLLSLVINGLIFWFIGQQLEDRLGAIRYLMVIGACAFGGTTALQWLAPSQLAAGAGVVVLGLLAAQAIEHWRSGADVRGYLVVLVLLMVYSMFLGSMYWIAQFGAVAGGAAAGFLLTDERFRGKRELALALLMAGLVGLTVANVVLPIG